MTFKTPILLLLIPLIVAALFIRYFRRQGPSFVVPAAAFFKGLPVTWRVRFRHVPFFLNVLAAMSLIVALAGPRTMLEDSRRTAEG
ncbi:MAG: BatA domain-containing protein, partial [Candidatus Omnitrophica bacterium]|nr:BatA domain-containing protein [Candidatus Omnitrophota bacterium]